MSLRSPPPRTTWRPSRPRPRSSSSTTIRPWVIERGLERLFAAKALNQQVWQQLETVLESDVKRSADALSAIEDVASQLAAIQSAEVRRSPAFEEFDRTDRASPFATARLTSRQPVPACSSCATKRPRCTAWRLPTRSGASEPALRRFSAWQHAASHSLEDPSEPTRLNGKQTRRLCSCYC